MYDPCDGPLPNERQSRRAHVYYVYEPSQQLYLDGYHCIYIHPTTPEAARPGGAALELAVSLFGLKPSAALA